MANIDFESIKKLPPEKRKKALKEVHEMLEKEIKKVKEQVFETERLLGIAETEESILEEIEVPKARKIEIKDLFKREDAEDLEKRIRALPKEERKNVERLAREPIEDVYARIKTFTAEATHYERAREKTAVYQSEKEEMEKRREIYELALLEKRRAEERGEYTLDKKKEHLMTAAEKLTYKRL